MMALETMSLGARSSRVGSISLHKPLSIAVPQDASFASDRFGNQDPQALDAGRMKLEEFHILKGNAASSTDSGAISGICIGIGSDPEHTSEPSCGEKNGFRRKNMDFSGRQLQGGDPATPISFKDQVNDMEFIVKSHIVFNALLVKGLQDHMPGPISGVTGAMNRRFSKISGMPAKTALIDSACREFG